MIRLLTETSLFHLASSCSTIATDTLVTNVRTKNEKRVWGVVNEWAGTEQKRREMMSRTESYLSIIVSMKHYSVPVTPHDNAIIKV